MAREYKLNPDAAKKADVVASRIDTTGKYVGTFTRAEAIVSTRGTEGIEFSFKADDGASADYLQIWTHKPTGEELRGFQMVQALMTCLKVRGLATKKQTLDKWDRDAGRSIPTECEVYPELMGKPIGLLLQREEYLATSGDLKSRMLIWGCFDAATGFTASEILEKATKPERLDELLPKLKDRPMASNVPAQRAPDHFGAGGGSDAGIGGMSDDIPFNALHKWVP